MHQHRTSAWVALIVTVAFVAGMAAFTLASPNQSARVQRDQLGFHTLDRDWFDARIRAAADASERADRETARQRQATTAARRWLGALPGAKLEPASIVRGVVVAPDSPESARRVAALRRWADGLPATRWRVVVGAATTPTTDGALMVATSMHVRIADADSRARILRTPVVLQLAPPAAAGRPWRVQDAQVEAAPRGLRAYSDPTIVSSGGVDVIAGAAARADAIAVAAALASSVGEVRERFAGIARASATTAWLHEGPSGLRRVAGASVALRDELHPMVRVEASGAVYVDLRAWRSAGAAARTSAVRHAAMHLATGTALDTLSPALREGVAAGFAGMPDADALDGVASATSPSIAALLVADPDAGLVGSARLDAAHVTGSWLLAVAGGDALVELVRQREGGIDADHAIRRALHATPAGVQARVRAWAGAGGRDPRELVADEGADQDATDGMTLGDDGNSETATDGDGVLAGDVAGTEEES